MRLISTVFLIFWSSVLAYSQSSQPVKYDRRGIWLSFGQTSGIDKSFRFSNGVTTEFLNPEITVFDGTNKLYLALGVLKFVKKKYFAVNASHVIVRHSVNGLEYFDYVLQNNDSLLLKYDKTIPLAANGINSSLKYDYNFDKYCKNYFAEKQYSALTKFTNPNFFHDSKREFSNNITKNFSPEEGMNHLIAINRGIKNRAYARAMLRLQAENKLLDSLKAQRQISDKPYHFYKSRVENLSYILDLETDRLTSDQVGATLAKFTENPYGYPEIYHHQMIESASDKYITQKAPYLNLKDGVNRDYRAVYTTIWNSTIFPEKDKNYLLARELSRIKETFPKADFLAFFQKFEQDVKDTALVSTIRAQYALEFDESRNATKSVVLTDSKGVKTTFDNLLKSHKGKVVYVDFWASWCAPCREGLPNSLKLRNELKGQEVVFIYVSIDRTMKPWQAASEQENLDDYRENYLFVNHQTSDFTKQQKLSSIPRYMIFDKTGKLVYANAPSAESKTLPGLLTGRAK